MVQDFAGTTALVTGSNSGPGKVAAQQPTERGAPRDSQQPGQAARAELKPLVFEGSVTVGGAPRRDTYLAKPRTRTALEGFFAAGDVVERTYPLRGRHGCGTLAGQQRMLTQRVLARRDLVQDTTDSSTRARIFIASQRGVIAMGVSSITDPEVHAFLTEGTRTGKLSFLSRSGRPLVTPVWFVVEGDTLVFNTGKDTAKGRALARDPRVSLCVDLEAPPYAFVQVQGAAKLSEDPDELVRTATAIAARYMGLERAEEFGKRNGVPGELVVRVRPAKVLASFNMTG